MDTLNVRLSQSYQPRPSIQPCHMAFDDEAGQVKMISPKVIGGERLLGSRSAFPLLFITFSHTSSQVRR